MSPTLHVQASASRLERLTCHPQNLSCENINQLIALATQVDPHELENLSPLYIKSVSHYPTPYRSLVICQDGTVKGSLWTTDRLVSAIFGHFGFSYQEWRAYWQATHHNATYIPYVCGQRALLRIPADRTRACDWIDLSICDALEVITPRGRSRPHELRLYYQLLDRDTYRFQFNFSERLSTLLQEIHLAYCLLKAWHYEKVTLGQRYETLTDLDPTYPSSYPAFQDPQVRPQVSHNYHPALTCFLYLQGMLKTLKDHTLQAYLPDVVTNPLRSALDDIILE